MDSCYLSIGQVASLLGVCTKTLRRWDAKRLFNADFRTKGNHRRYKKSKIFAIDSKKKEANYHSNEMCDRWQSLQLKTKEIGRIK